MKALVTGGAGFLGSHLVDLLRADGIEVVVPRSAQTDLTDTTAVADLFQAEHPDMVFHLAAEVGGIGANRDNPGRYWYANLMMGVNVLEQARIHGTEKVVMVGTICSYPKFAPIPFREETLWDGYPEETNAPYGVAKKALLVGAQAYREQYGLNAIVLLPVNLYGPRDNFDLQSSHVIPALIRKMIEARDSGAVEVTLWGDGTPTREFLFVEDAARGLLLAGRDYNGAEPVNLGTGTEISIKDLAETVATATGFEGEIIWDTTKPNGQPRRQLDVTRAKETFGFEAEVSFAEGMARTVAWYSENPS
jgi:GDP-L-fucose synthase